MGQGFESLLEMCIRDRDITDEALERAESVLQRYAKNDNRPTLPRSAGADPNTVPYRAGPDPLRGAFGLGKDE